MDNIRLVIDDYQVVLMLRLVLAAENGNYKHAINLNFIV